MSFSRRTAALFVALWLLASCSDSPRPTSTAVTVSSVSVGGLPPTLVPGQTAQLTATASFSDASTQVVTSLVNWQSSNTSAATISAGGMVTAVAPGPVEISATYQGQTGRANTQVESIAAQAAFTLNGVVTETGTTRPVVGAQVQAIDGVNSGRSTTTDGNGFYNLAPLLASTFTLRATAAGFEPADVPIGLTGDTRRDFQMRRIPAVLNAVIDGGGSFEHNVDITFSGLRSTSTPNPIARYVWNCGQSGNTACDRTGPTVQFRYRRSQSPAPDTVTYTVTLTIEDTVGNQDSATTAVTITNQY